jgi:hypothetical protein
MQGKNKANKKFEKEIFKNPIKLLEIIKKNCLDYQEHCYEMSIILDSIKTMANMKQKEHKSLQDYTKQFKTVRDVMKAHIGGPLILTKFVEEMDDYDVVEAKIFQEKVFNQFMAYTYLDNADKAKHGTLLTGLNTQISFKNNQYPKTVTEAATILSNHHWDNVGKTNNNNSTNNNKHTDNEKGEDKNDETPEMSFAMLEGKCYSCRKAGHKSPDCHLRDKTPKEDWAINKVKAQEQTTEHTEQSHLNAN